MTGDHQARRVLTGAASNNVVPDSLDLERRIRAKSLFDEAR
jgi:hypothetical protein